MYEWHGLWHSLVVAHSLRSTSTLADGSAMAGPVCVYLPFEAVDVYPFAEHEMHAANNRKAL